MSESKSTSGGIGFCGLLAIAFIVLKLCKVITWSWWWVLSPIWIPAAVAIIVLTVYGVIVFMEKKEKEERHKSGYDEYAGVKSKWQERLDQMQEAQKKRDTNKSS